MGVAEPRIVVLEHASARVELERVPDGRRRVTVHPNGPSRPILRNGCLTSYPTDLIGLILDAAGPAALCDEMARDEDPSYTAATLAPDILAYVSRGDFARRSVLDFGCGGGASTMILGRLFPRSRIVGVDCREGPLRVAEARARHHGVGNVAFSRSPGRSELPDEMGRFHYAVLSAVYEHLLPAEREVLLGAIWSRIEPGGVMFISQTPQRYFPVEVHTTHLPLINYLPAALALFCARRFSPFYGREVAWEYLLGAGIRGATSREVLSILRRSGTKSKPVLMKPRRLGLQSRTDLWHAGSTFHSYPRLKRLVRLVSGAVEAFSGVAVVPYLSLAIRKG